MKEWYTIPELASYQLPDMPQSQRGIDAMAKARGWRAVEGMARPAARRGGGWEYHFRLLPKTAQAKLLLVQSQPDAERAEVKARREALWARFEILSDEQKAICEARLKALDEFHSLRAAKVNANSAASIVAGRMGVSRATIFNWLSLVDGHGRTDWLAALAPSFPKGGERSDCHAAAWTFLKSDYLRPEKPSFSACYRRLLKAAKKEGWSPIPSERALRRRLDAEVPEAVQVLARSGREKAKTLYPAQRRTRQDLQAMQAVNMDGHKIDVFVQVPWSEKPVRMYLLAIQDLFSGKILSWRLSDAETWETVRLVIGDMVERFGIPDHIYLDNGRAFASKWISGQTRQRFRFRVKEEDPRGLLTTLGIHQHFTTPYSGQSKPIERAFRDLADMIAKHPFCAGAYTGNRPDAKPENYMSRAIPLQEFQRHVGLQIADHNAQPGRRAANCAGRSFDETFAASMETAIVRWPTAAQKSLWLLGSEALRAKKGSGEVHFQGNRYWHVALNQHAGKKVTIRFDPDALHQPVKVYDLNNVLICEAACISDEGFGDIDAARRHARARRDYEKAVAAQKQAHAVLSAQQLADILYRGEPAEPSKAPPIRPKVTRIAGGNLALDQAPADAISEEEFEDSFSRALGLITRDASILPFPKGNNEPMGTAYGSDKRGGKNPAR